MILNIELLKLNIDIKINDDIFKENYNFKN